MENKELFEAYAALRKMPRKSMEKIAKKLGYKNSYVTKVRAEFDKPYFEKPSVRFNDALVSLMKKDGVI